MAYYDDIAKSWHETTGHEGDAFKKLVLNPILLDKLPGIDRRYILELGGGNGYFLPLVLRRFPDQVPAIIIVTDKSGKLLRIARQQCGIPGAQYLTLDVAQPFPFAGNQFDLLIASMLFNEVPSRVFRKALRECQRVLAPDGLCLISITHPDFIESLQRRGLLKMSSTGTLTMPGSGNLRLPIVIRSMENYRLSLKEAGFQYEETECYPTPEVIKVKAGLRHAWKVPVALVYSCTKAR